MFFACKSHVKKHLLKMHGANDVYSNVNRSG